MKEVVKYPYLNRKEPNWVFDKDIDRLLEKIQQQSLGERSEQINVLCHKLKPLMIRAVNKIRLQFPQSISLFELEDLLHEVWIIVQHRLIDRWEKSKGEFVAYCSATIFFEVKKILTKELKYSSLFSDIFYQYRFNFYDEDGPTMDEIIDFHTFRPHNSSSLEKTICHEMNLKMFLAYLLRENPVGGVLLAMKFKEGKCSLTFVVRYLKNNANVRISKSTVHRSWKNTQMIFRKDYY